MTELEKEFSELAKAAHAEIKEKLDEALKSLKEAEEISNKYGIPFESYISPHNNVFVPSSFKDKLNEYLNVERVNNLLGLYLDEYFYYGWAHSSDHGSCY